jgi:hypothetical protein
MRRVNSKGLLK